MRRRASVILLAAIAAAVVVAIVRHGRGGGPIPIPSSLPTPPRLARPLGAALDAAHARHDRTYRTDSSPPSRR